MKTCSKCKKNKPIEDFPRNGMRGDGRGAYCKLCQRPVGRENYRRHKERYILKAKERDKNLFKLINSYKDKPCTDCKQKYPPYVMDFDHLGDKEFGICEMRRRRMSFEKIILEIKKCEVVCANCHRIRTNKRQPPRKL